MRQIELFHPIKQLKDDDSKSTSKVLWLFWGQLELFYPIKLLLWWHPKYKSCIAVVLKAASNIVPNETSPHKPVALKVI